MTEEQIRTMNVVLSGIINVQKDLSQPIYVIASFWCGIFKGITTVITTEGDKDYEEIKKLFMEKYAWKENQIGVTEQTYRLIRIDLKEMLDCEGKEKK